MILVDVGVTSPWGRMDAVPDPLGFVILAGVCALFMRSLGNRPSREPARRATGAFALGFVTSVPEAFLVHDLRLAWATLAMTAAGAFFLTLALYRVAWESADGELADASGAAMAGTMPLAVTTAFVAFDLNEALVTFVRAAALVIAMAAVVYAVWRAEEAARTTGLRRFSRRTS